MKIPFPFAISFKKDIEFAEFSSEKIELLTKNLKMEAVEITSTSRSLIEFDVSLFRLVLNWNIMIPVDHGQLQIQINNNKTQLEYKVSFLRFCLLATVMSIIMWRVSDDMNIFLITLTLFLGLNWIIGWIRHKFYFIGLIKKLKTCHNNG